MIHLSWTASNTLGIEAIRANDTQGFLGDFMAIISSALEIR